MLTATAPLSKQACMYLATSRCPGPGQACTPDVMRPGSQASAWLQWTSSTGRSGTACRVCEQHTGRTVWRSVENLQQVLAWRRHQGLSSSLELVPTWRHSGQVRLPQDGAHGGGICPGFRGILNHSPQLLSILALIIPAAQAWWCYGPGQQAVQERFLCHAMAYLTPPRAGQRQLCRSWEMRFSWYVRACAAARLSWVQLCQASTPAAAEHDLGGCHLAVPASLAQWEAGIEGKVGCGAPHLQAT